MDAAAVFCVRVGPHRPEGADHLPHFQLPEGYTDGWPYFEKLCLDGFAWRYPNGTEENRQQLRYEMEMIRKMGFVDYFLIVWDFINYAREQGSAHSDKLYMAYSRLANKYAGIETRDTATGEQLNELSIYERIALNMMQAGMRAGKHYKAIYQDTKTRFEAVQDMAFLA